MTNPTTAIKSMKLYSSVDRIYNEVRALGRADHDVLDVDDLVPFDQYHYHGTDAVDKAVQPVSQPARATSMSTVQRSLTIWMISTRRLTACLNQAIWVV